MLEDRTRYTGWIRRLSNERGVDFRERTPSSGEQAVAWIQDGLRGRLEFGWAAFFYAQRDTELTLYVIDSYDGLVETEVIDVSRARLIGLVEAMRAELGLEEPGLLRTPISRTRGSARSPVLAKRANAAQQLADILLPPRVRARFEGLGAIEIIGDGVIAAVPFAMLPLDEKRMVVDESIVSIAAGLVDVESPPSWWSRTSMWGLHPQSIGKDGRSPTYDDNGCSVEADGRRLRRFGVMPPLVVGNPLVPSSERSKVKDLPAAEQEARAIAKAYGVQPLIGAAATKAEVLKRMCEASIIHIAAHGIADPANPLDGGFLMLAGSEPKAAFLTAREVQSMRFDADLVVLSACQSGLGFSHEGGMMGLARAFRIAGASRVIMTLWSVDDDATSFLMERFQHYLQKPSTRTFPESSNLTWPRGHSPGEALRLAQIDTKQYYPNPKFWAGFTLFGPPF
ncbi:CHAT domain-containing protein [Sphingomonas sp.]|uniref:CHAT domain-containing protein n=1 Tax=Sphingomonas sp. TaxID=28214 RepID=UPI0017FAD8AF|nr:CHAT domain-containing protein [Sphingomonas sp.]MBA4762048.1 CHAT domain-containing protein [Sphingomonas sp.]